MRVLLQYLELYKRYKWMLIFSIILTVITMLANVCLLMLSGWFISTSAVAGVAGLYNFNYMLPAAGMRIVAIIRTVGRYFERLVSHDATFRVLQHLRIFTFSRLIPLSPAKLCYFRQGELLNRVVSDVDTLDRLYLSVISPLTGVFILIIITTVGLSILDITLAFILGSIALLVLLLLPSFFYRAGKPIGENLIYLRGEYRQQLISWLHNQTELTLFGARQRYRKQIDSIELYWYRAQYRQSKLTALSQALIILISGIAVISILYIAISIDINRRLQPRTLITIFVLCSLAVFEMLTPVTNAFQHLGEVIASALRINQLIEQQPEVQFSEKYTQVPSYVELCLQNVTFTYNLQLQPALKNVTLHISAGEHVAILGRTGCGKSTLLQLLTRAWDPQHGLININTIPLTNFSEQTLRCIMSVVTQRVHLFSATLRNNLQLAAPSADDTQISAVLKQVGLQKLLVGEGLNTWLGEGGRQLSGGELRSLAIARALLHNAPLMLLDEPMEGLDFAIEKQILGLFKQVMKDKTILMVTHRLRWLNNFDRIIVMDNGQIIEQGNYIKILEKQGRRYSN